MPSPITEEAIRIIDAAPEHGPLQPVEYARGLPPQAGALKRVLSDDRIADAAARCHVADAAAGKAQRGFKGLGRLAAYSGFAAAVLGGVLLFLGSDPAQETLLANLGLAQFAFLLISLLGALLLFLSKPYRKWRAERGNAEAMRLRVFALMMAGGADARDGEVPLLPLQLECFRRHLLDDQRNYFARRGLHQRLTVLAWQLLGVVAFLLILASSLPQLRRLEPYGLLPEILRSLLSWLPLGEPSYALAGLIGGSLQGLLAALAVMSPAHRNADKFEEMCDRLDEQAGEALDAARVAATEADFVAVRAFAKRISNDLAEEAREWLLLQEVLSEMALTHLARQPKA